MSRPNPNPTPPITPTRETRFGQLRAPVEVRVSNSAPTPSLSIIVPTYREAENLPTLLRRLAALRDHNALDFDTWIMDDQSRDGSREAVASLNLPWVTLIERTGPRGLSPAVLDGIAASAGRRILVMDADLSHPPAAIPAMLAALDAGADFAVGSRYVTGGGTDDDWGLFRRLNSRAATLLARPLTTLRDPMSGFFALDRRALASAGRLNPVGYKVGLEILVKSRAKRVAEIPIQFADRHAGKSKLTPLQQLQYLEHLRRLYVFKLTGR